MMGWSIMVNLIAVMLVYYYIPPDGSGLHVLLSQKTIFGVFTLMALITAGGRLIDAFYDPFIGRVSDRTKTRRGRRIPFMLFSVLPSVVFCILVFVPMTKSVSGSNAAWLTITLTLFFMATTTYIIPYYSLLPELASTNKDKIRLSTFQQVGFVLGMIISSLTNNIADLCSSLFHLTDRATAIEFSVIALALFGGVAMLVPIFTIDENKYCNPVPSSTPLLKALRESFSNSNFRYFLVATFSFSTALNLITSGLLFFVTVLCGMAPSDGSRLVIFLVFLSLLFYPVINILAKLYNEKRIMVISFFILAFVFSGIAVLGKVPVLVKPFFYVLIAITSFPLASLGILPNALLARLSSEDKAKSGDSREGTFFAVNYFAVKLGQTLGISLFAILTIYGKDPGHDFGLRLSGVFGFFLCILAGLVFIRFKENNTAKNRE